MTVYIDYIFLENVIYNLVIILQTAFLSRKKINKIKFGIAGVIGSVYVCIMILLGLDFLNYFWSKLFLSFVIIYVAFTPKNLGAYFKLVGIYYLATVINVGGCMVVKQMMVANKSINILTKVTVYLISLIFTYMYTKQFWRIYKNRLNSSCLIQKVIIKIEGKEYTYKGFLDTGNTVQNYDLNVPVVFAEYLNNEQRRKVEKMPQYDVAVSTISKESREKVILIKKAQIGERIADIGIVFVEKKLNRNNEYNMILNLNLFEDKLGGIYI